MDQIQLIDRLLQTIEAEIVPLTRRGVAAGNKLFGAAVLRKSDLSLVVAGTNDAIFPGRRVVARAGEILDRPRTVLVEDGHLGTGSSEEAMGHLVRFLAETDE